MRPALSLVSALLLVTVGAAGCVGFTDDAAEPTAAPDAAAVSATLRELLAGVPCEVDAVPMDATSDNLVPVGALAFNVDEEGIRAELDIRGELGLVAAYQRGGFDVIDVADPTDIRLVASYASEHLALDVKFSPDGTAALVGDGAGVEVVDIREPAAPASESFWAFPGSGNFQNAHMLYTARIAETDWVFVAPNADRGVDVLTLDGAPGARTLTYVTSWAPLGILGGGPLGPHDMWVTHDAELDVPLLYVANGFEGWAVADVSDPSSPALLGVTPNQDLHQGYTHTIQAGIVDGRRLVATIEEVGANSLKLYDATDLRIPILLGSWVLDHTHPTWPQHNLQIVGDKLYVAHYAEGMFVFDLAAAPAVPLSGLYRLMPMAHFAGAGNAATDVIPFSNVWDVVLDDGIVYTSDTDEGVTALGFGCLVPGDAAATSTG